MALSISEKIEIVKARLHELEREVEGCTEKDIEKLKQAQNVSYLPEMYRQLMLLMGRKGIGWLLDGHADYGFLKENVKERFSSKLTRNNVNFPSNIYVFMEHQGYQYYLFETHEGIDDPTVWGYWEADCFYKLDDTLSSFILEELNMDQESYRENMDQRMATAYYYDPEKQDFLVRSHPDPDR